MNGAIPQEEFDVMAEEAANFLPETINIFRDKGGDDEAGGEESGKDQVGFNVKARLAPGGATAMLRAIADKMNVDFPWTLTVPAFTDIEPEDEFTWNTRRFTVIQPMERDYEVTRRALCEEIK